MNLQIIQRVLEKKKLLDTYRPLPSGILAYLEKNIMLEWTYNSNAIEGNSLTLRETRLVLEKGMTISGKNLREHFEAKNHERAIEYLETKVEPAYVLNERDILNIHALVLSGIEEDFAGRYRIGRVRILGANFIPPNALKISDLMAHLMRTVNENVAKKDIVSLVAYLHHRFVWIHPFFDGNGRTARLITNMVLMKYGFPPSIILKNDRKKYYAALNKANNGNYEKLTLLIAQSIERSLDMYLDAIGAYQSEHAEYMLLSQLAPDTPYSLEYLSLLARRGKIDAFKERRNWYSNKQAIDEYVKNRMRKRKIN
jgi:Fic family protein